ncbi:hypothetical protein AV530_015076 [Patagioenas fasciata monilis]|uniref:Uncharacterized protein n=1 Tax=Patagioenas fasciata monilis TaxID=372326 RepID=A0A1V4K0U7_PATFA|nr:hypothetical protein AV530_015076 [Patagioenas fasciata monilis]
MLVCWEDPRGVWYPVAFAALAFLKRNGGGERIKARTAPAWRPVPVPLHHLRCHVSEQRKTTEKEELKKVTQNQIQVNWGKKN